MPHLSVTLALPVVPTPEVLRALSAGVSEAIGKPEAYVAVDVSSKMMLFAGTSEPAACCHLSSIGKIDLEHNSAVSTAVANALAPLGIPSDRVYVGFTDFARENWGFRGATFANLPAS